MAWSSSSLSSSSLGSGDTTPIGTTDRTAMGLYDRLLVGHSARPCGVGWVSEPGRRIVIKTVRRRQPVKLESDPAGHPPTTLTQPSDQINGATRSSLPAAGWPENCGDGEM